MDETMSDAELETRIMDFLRAHGPATTEEVYEAVWGEPYPVVDQE
jgi:predicted transcriptional regulator